MDWPENDYRNYLIHADQDMKYGIPEKKKYPMPDRDHVMSAIKFFNYVTPGDEKELARNIIARIKEYGITGINVGENNRFKRYYKEDSLMHYGIPGMHWGVRRFQNPDGSYTKAGKARYSNGGGLMDKLTGNGDAKKRLAEFSSIARSYGYDAGEPTKDYSKVLFTRKEAEEGFDPTIYYVRANLKAPAILPKSEAHPSTNEDVHKMFEYSENYRKNATKYNSMIRDAIANDKDGYVSKKTAKNLTCYDVMVNESGMAIITMGSSELHMEVDFDIKRKRVMNIGGL